MFKLIFCTSEAWITQTRDQKAQTITEADQEVQPHDLVNNRINRKQTNTSHANEFV